MAGLIVNAMVSTAEEILDMPTDRPEVEDDIVRVVERRLRLVALAVPHWRSAGGDVSAPPPRRRARTAARARCGRRSRTAPGRTSSPAARSGSRPMCWYVVATSSAQ